MDRNEAPGPTVFRGGNGQTETKGDPKPIASQASNNDISEVKSKFLCIWNNVKYSVSSNLKANIAKDCPVWLLGRIYHKRPASTSTSDPSLNTPQLQKIPPFSYPDDGIDAFQQDFYSRVWLTYRRSFPVLGSPGSTYSTDCGWGCMLRSGQMLLAQALVLHFLGRDWRLWPKRMVSNPKVTHDEAVHRSIIRLFGDSMSPSSPFSLHRIVSLGEETGKKAGDWYGPASVTYLLKNALHAAWTTHPQLQKLEIYVAQDCTVYIGDIDTMLNANGRSVILLIPMRLGAEKLNPLYIPCIQALFSLGECLGIIGGRPKHSLIFIGCQENQLLHLDPHHCHEFVDVEPPDFDVSSFHCRRPRKLSALRMDPSCCVGFYIKDSEHWQAFREHIHHCLIPAHPYPMFAFASGTRPQQDSADWEWVATPPPSLPEDDCVLTEDFEFL